MNTYAIVEVATGHIMNLALWDGTGSWATDIQAGGQYIVRLATPADVIWVPAGS